MPDQDQKYVPQGALSGLRQNIHHDDLAFDIVKPFGPSILETVLPGPVLANMLKLTDNILADAQRQSWGRYLVGQIREEPRITIQDLQQFEVLDYLKMLFAEYVIGCMYCDANLEYKQGVGQLKASGQYVNPTRIEIESAWVISQKPGEYNPIHSHSKASLTSVMYLKLPERMEGNAVPDKQSTDGNIEFVDRSVGDNIQHLQASTARLAPQVGRFYIFPASLLHLVYPFSGEGERRSVSINVTHQI